MCESGPLVAVTNQTIALFSSRQNRESTLQSREEIFAELYSRNQQRLMGYVVGLVRNMTDAQDILQQTAITAWRKFDDFDPETDFVRWVIAIARFETLNFVKYRRRSKVFFDQSLMEQLGEQMCEGDAELAESRSRALAVCLKKLPPSDGKLIECRYTFGLGSNQMSEIFERSQSSICNSLRRIREVLLQCIKRQLATEGRNV